MRRWFAGSVMLLAAVFGAMAQTAAEAAHDAEEVSTEDLTMEQSLALPEVPAKLNAFVKGYMKREAIALHKAGYKVETMRKGEIVIATIPTDKLFAPNDTILMPTAQQLLRTFLPYFKTPDKFKVILAIHTDDSGSDKYLSDLSSKRIMALYDYFDANASHTDNLIGYPIAGNEPLRENTSRAGRADNRRLEIYILPYNGLIEEIKKSR